MAHAFFAGGFKYHTQSATEHSSIKVFSKFPLQGCLFFIFTCHWMVVKIKHQGAFLESLFCGISISSQPFWGSASAANGMEMPLESKPKKKLWCVGGAARVCQGHWGNISYTTSVIQCVIITPQKHYWTRTFLSVFTCTLLLFLAPHGQEWTVWRRERSLCRFIGGN